MSNIKHVGRLLATGRKCIVAYRTLPGDAYNCLIISTENLSDSYHDALINLVESAAGQDAYEFAEVLARSQFPDGSTMLASLHTKGKLIKVPTDAIEMIPNSTTRILLSELNQLIAEQRGVPVDELSVKSESESESESVKPVPTTTSDKSVQIDEPTELIVKNLSPEEQAKKYRSEADRLAKEAAKYRRLAEELSPNPQTIRRRTRKKEVVSSVVEET